MTAGNYHNASISTETTKSRELTGNRLADALESAFDGQNYNQISLPTTAKTVIRYLKNQSFQISCK